ncbi:hypothetical protein [Porticoccus sp.]|uniref:hypothetical protein n=1 Tax=Porticoccus sp. TaxID=2024853 RepID=UPI003F6996D7
MKKYALIVIVFISTLLCGCEKYIFTFNEQPVLTTPELFTGYRIPDPALAVCVEQAIKDLLVTSANQLSQLNCSNAGITDLSGLEIFTGLTFVNLAQNRLTTIKPLLYLPKLDSISLEGNSSLDCLDGERLKEQIEGQTKLPKHC